MIARLSGRITPTLVSSISLIAASTLAYGLDYLFNVVAFRQLGPEQFGVVFALVGIGQIIVVVSRVIQTVATRMVARLDAAERNAASFFYPALQRATWLAAAVLVVSLLLSAPLARSLNLTSLPPVWALGAFASLAMVRPIVGGTLQGRQQFGQLGAVQVVQASVRLAAGILLMVLGYGAFGAMVALPIASLIAFLYGWRVLRLRPSRQPIALALPDLFRYSTYTAAGLIGFALLINMDAILAKRFFDGTTAGLYGSAVTLGKVIQFFPVAVIMILFPKAAQRRASRRSTRTILLPALAIVTLVCGAIAVIYFLIPDLLMQVVFGTELGLNRNVLGRIGLAMLLLSLANVWLNYFLSVERMAYVACIWLAVVLQFGLMLRFHREPYQLPTIMAFNGLWLTVAGAALALWRRRA